MELSKTACHPTQKKDAVRDPSKRGAKTGFENYKALKILILLRQMNFQVTSS